MVSDIGRRRWTVGVDFGGTNVKVGLVDRRGRVVRATVLPSKVVARPGRFVEAVGDTVTDLARMVQLRPSQLAGVGIGAPGPVDVEHGRIRFLVNVPGWREVPLAGRLARRLRCRCVVDNDANLFALGEWRFGAGRGARALIGMTLGTGVGGGLILNGRLYRGAADAAGELGHMVVEPHGRRCGCGRRGCLEAQVGTAAVLSLGRRALKHGAPVLRRLVREARGRLTPAMISQAAVQGDRAARAIWAEVGGWLGLGVANLVNLLNPDRIVIGGGLSNAWAWFHPAMMKILHAEAMPVSARAVRLARARLGDDAGIVGAAVLVWNGKMRSAR